MKKAQIFIIIIVISSCTKVLDLDLNASDPQIAVEANLGTDEFAMITLTESVNFDDENTFPIIENAIVKISDNLGNTETLSETSPGVYQTVTLKGKIKTTYTLEINIDDKSMRSICAIPQQVGFDSLIVKKATSSNNGGPGGGSG